MCSTVACNATLMWVLQIDHHLLLLSRCAGYHAVARRLPAHLHALGLHTGEALQQNTRYHAPHPLTPPQPPHPLLTPLTPPHPPSPLLTPLTPPPPLLTPPHPSSPLPFSPHATSSLLPPPHPSSLSHRTVCCCTVQVLLLYSTTVCKMLHTVLCCAVRVRCAVRRLLGRPIFASQGGLPSLHLRTPISTDIHLLSPPSVLISAWYTNGSGYWDPPTTGTSSAQTLPCSTGKRLRSEEGMSSTLVPWICLASPLPSLPFPSLPFPLSPYPHPFC